MASSKLISREEALGGMRGRSNRQANIVFALIEARTARLVAENRAVNAPYLTESAHQERSLEFLQAIAAQASPSVKPSIQDLERMASQWSSLVPDNPAIRAELAHKLGQNYRFTKETIPRIAEALTLDDPAVGRLFQQHQRAPIRSIYQTRLSAAERAKWTWFGFNDWLESLPPFWTAFALTLTETVGAGALALPIALATIGPLAGAVILVFIGLINVLTVAYMAEASARNGPIRYGSAYIGRVVRDFLGAPAAWVLRLGLFAFCCSVLIAFYTGFSTTLGAISGIPDPVWIAVLFGIGIVLILRKQLLGTVASALLISFVNIAILVMLSLITLFYASWENFTHVKVPFLFGEPYDTAAIQLVFGVVLLAYFGHVSVSNCAKAVLRHAADGSALKRGTITAMLVAIALYTLWTIAVGSAIEPERLASEGGTALVPLAEQIGPGIYLLGSVFVVLGLGMGSIHYSLGLFNMVRELLDSSNARLQKLYEPQFGAHLTSLLALMPLFMVFLYAQWAYFTGTQSFTKPLELLGAILTPVLASLFPVLLLLASRRKGLAAAGAMLPTWLSNPVILGIIIILACGSLILHGTVIWDEPISQTAALATAALMAYLIIDLLRRKAFAPLLVIEIRHHQESGDRAAFSIARKGQALATALHLHYRNRKELIENASGEISRFSTLQSVVFELPPSNVRAFRTHVHKVTPEGDLETIKGQLFVVSDEERQCIDLTQHEGWITATLAKAPCRLEMVFGSNV